MNSEPQQENEPAGRVMAGWMAGLGTVAMALGVALLVLYTGRDYLPADAVLVDPGIAPPDSPGPLLASIIARLLIYGGMALLLFSWLSGRKSPGLF